MITQPKSTCKAITCKLLANIRYYGIIIEDNYAILGDTIQAMNEKTEELIHKAYEELKDGAAESAMGFLKNALELDFEHEEVIYALKCLNWWFEKIKRVDELCDPYERGGYILSQWESYHYFLGRIDEAGLPREAVDSGLLIKRVLHGHCPLASFTNKEICSLSRICTNMT